MQPLADSELDMGLFRTQSTFASYVAGPTQNSTLAYCTMQVPWDDYPEWCTHLALTMFDVHVEKVAVLNRLRAELEEEARSLYTVISLRGCPRGLPLIPCESITATSTTDSFSGFFREPSDSTTWRFVDYLTHFCERANIGLETKGEHDKGFNNFFDSMFSQQLVPYQAVVLTEKWKIISNKFLELFQSQSSAYRKLRGGKGAPKIHADHRPRFVTESNADADAMDLNMGKLKDDLIVRNTFLEFRPVAAESAFAPWQRAAEYP
eukprot:TRINITY_DN54947_c0_g1_i1.p1 TRINITY_DN54947_c0_g1~~TRINITY_DN54947_c0_g1_i1.p1  ORF type:complete len:264 (-),score=37.02 TRINITY_DN54947_c0_g1_i1:371-1162(-)